tara:strand:+ start:1797 stop:2477 length:681 start_codon:yes stop_codon:yes gene_type:complete
MPFPSIITITAPVNATLDAIGVSRPAEYRFGDILFTVVFVDAGFGNTIDTYNPAGLNSSTLLANTAAGVRRGVALYSYERENETTQTIYVTTSAADSTLTACTVLVRDGKILSDGVHAVGTVGVNSSTTPSPASITTTIDESLALACILYDNTGTITNISSNSWAQFGAVQNDTVRSISVQMRPVGSAATISGGTATLGTSGNWGVITFAVKPAVPLFLPSSVQVS